ncbi:MAG: efflux RND transporter periplasmic adaptor subunit [Betaproteobacteria bacterium]|nr:MAG: efflux RND transporter periplasmic adaptor subunit [Betaproteobacteria bacterium]
MRKLVIGVIVLAALGAAAFWFFGKSKPVPVIFSGVEMGTVESTISNTRAGTITACRRARLAPRAGGQIAQLSVREGDRVEKGEILLTLWNADVSARLRLAQDQKASAQSRRDEVCLNADLAARELKRARQLKDQGFISDEALDRSRAQAQAGKAACSAADANVRQSDSQIAAVRAELSTTYLRAPFAGIVAEVTGEIGEFTTPSPPGIPTPPAVDLIDDTCLYVTAPMDEIDAPKIIVGQPGRISIDAFPGQQFSGHVRRIAPYVLDREKQARTVDVEVEFDDPSQFRTLLVGYSADVEIVLATRENVMRVPTSALIDGNKLYVLNPTDGTLDVRVVETGLSNWANTEIVSGLSISERIVLSTEREGLEQGVLLEDEEEIAP